MADSRVEMWDDLMAVRMAVLLVENLVVVVVEELVQQRFVRRAARTAEY